MSYMYVFSFLLCIPLVWNILYSLRFENLFKKDHIWQIKTAYVITTVVVSHLLASAITTFASNIYGLF